MGLFLTFQWLTLHVFTAGGTQVQFLVSVVWPKNRIEKKKNFSLGTPLIFVVVQLLSHLWLFAMPRTTTYQVILSFTSSQSLLKLMSIESMMPSNHLILCHNLLFLPSIFPMSHHFPSSGLSIGASVSASILPMDIQGCFL